jgi:CTP synthase (UTP-ammonia lyase)
VSETLRVAVIGDRQARFDAQDTIEPALEHAAQSIGVPVPRVEWIATDALAASGVALLEDADAIWCAPGSPYRSLDGALAGIRFARASGRPFLGTCAGFQHAVLEVARNVLGLAAAHAEYGAAAPGEALFIDELLCSLVGQEMRVRVVDPALREWYGTDEAGERYYCRFGLNPAYVSALADAGFAVAGVDASDGDTRILRLTTHPFFVGTLFVPQTRSTPASPHPLIVAFLRAATR